MSEYIKREDAIKAALSVPPYMGAIEAAIKKMFPLLMFALLFCAAIAKYICMECALNTCKNELKQIFAVAVNAKTMLICAIKKETHHERLY